MKIKICGMKYAENIADIAALKPDFMGFIFYPKSKRYVGEDFQKSIVENIPEGIKKVGVFVNESFENIVAKCAEYDLDAVQLHGNETPAFCQLLSKLNIVVIKAVLVDERIDFAVLSAYEPWCNYFLFDTKTDSYGGSGQTFNWALLEQYKLNTPFFLSGGLGLKNINQALRFQHPMLYGVDVNSKLESEPGRKQVEACKSIIDTTRKYEHI